MMNNDGDKNEVWVKKVRHSSDDDPSCRHASTNTYLAEADPPPTEPPWLPPPKIGKNTVECD